MVRQPECEKTRRTNMANSSINATPKKGGAGGSFTRGSAQDITDYGLSGYDLSTVVGVTTVAAPFSVAIEESSAIALAYDVQLDSEKAFPALVPANMTPEKGSKPCQPPAAADAEDATSDWVLVPKGEVGKSLLCKGSLQSFDAQHPRNTFAKIANPKQVKATKESEESELDIDWSHAGIPTEVTKQIIHASMTPSHRSPHAKEQASAVSLSVLRVQNVGSRKRENSTPKTPRSSSKPRATNKQAAGRR